MERGVNEGGVVTEEMVSVAVVVLVVMVLAMTMLCNVGCDDGCITFWLPGEDCHRFPPQMMPVAFSTAPWRK